MLASIKLGLSLIQFAWSDSDYCIGGEVYSGAKTFHRLWSLSQLWKSGHLFLGVILFLCRPDLLFARRSIHYKTFLSDI